MIRTILALLVLCSVAAAEPPKAVIVGLDKVEHGALNKVDSTGSIGDHKTWEVEYEPGTVDRVARARRIAQAEAVLRSANREVGPDRSGKWEIANGGDSLFLPSFPGVYRVFLAVSNADGVVIAKHKILVLADSTPPDVPPDDDPPDDDPPDVPDVPNFGLTASARTWLAKVPVGQRTQATAIAAAYRKVGNDAIAGKYATIADVEKAAGEALIAASRAGSLDAAAWKPFGENLNAAFAGLRASGLIVTARDYGFALLEVCEGIE